MAFGCQVNDTVYFFVLHQLVERFEVTDIHFHELVIRLVFDVLQIGKVTGVCQLVQTNDVIFWVLVYKQTYHVATDKSGTTCNDDIFHIQ